MNYRQKSICLCLLAVFLFYTCPKASSDPVASFIAAADSIADVSESFIFIKYVNDHSMLVGAVIGKLIDEAVEAGDTGSKDVEKKIIFLAEKIAGVFENSNKTHAAQLLIDIYNRWSGKERSIRRRAKQLETQSKQAQAAGDLQKAEDLLLEAMKLYDSIGDERSTAIIWGSLGVVYWYAGDFQGVIEHYNKALAARRHIKDRILEGKTLNGLGSANYQLGNYNEALTFYSQAAGLRRNTGDISGLATSLTYMGNAFMALGKSVEARKAFEDALGILSHEGRPGQRFELLNSIASLNAEMGRIKSSNESFQQAINIAASLGDPLREMTARNNLALNYGDAYQYSAALEELETVKALLDKHPDSEQSIIYYRNRGLTYLGMGELQRSRDDLLKMLELSRQSEAPVYELDALINIGYLYQYLGAFKNGLGFAEKAKTLAGELDNPRMVRDAIVLAAELKRCMGRYDESGSLWRQALVRDKNDRMDAKAAADRLGIANALAESGRVLDARKRYFNSRPFIETSGDGDLNASLLFGLGHTYEQSNPDSAVYYYGKALDLLENTRSGLGGAEIRTGYLGGLLRHYYEEVALYYASREMQGPGKGWSDLAFRTIERAKARGLLDLIEKSASINSSPAEEALLDSLYQLDFESAGYNERRRDIEDEYTRIRDERVRHSAASISSNSIAGIADARKALSKNTVMLYYALGDSSSLLWAVDKHGDDVFELPGAAPLREVVMRLRGAIANRGTGDAALRHAAVQLYKILVSPAVRRIAGAKKLVIVPDGCLFDLPFEILITKESDGDVSWGNLHYLARSYVTTYSPSASVFAALEHGKTVKFDRDLLAFGDPDYTNASYGRFARLAHSQSEVDAISAFAKSDRRSVFLGKRADETTLKKMLQSGSSRIIHIAAHGMVDPADPLESCIALSPGPEGDDGRFHTLEILSCRMNSGLVVLSACRSARGQIGRGEGVVGLSRAFLASGASGVIASLWAVSDESTSMLMKKFYERMLKNKKPAGEALKYARLSMIREKTFSHPFYWAPFIAIGSTAAPWRH